MKLAYSASFFCLGGLFGLGLLVSGLVRPSVIIGGLDFTGAWDPRMLVGVVTSVTVMFFARRAILRRNAPVFAVSFPPKTPPSIDVRLVTGAALFGFGWGLCGNCPGQSMVALAGSSKTVVFVCALVAGMALLRAWDSWRSPSATPAPACG